MADAKKPGVRRISKRRSSVSIGGMSQSAFAGYATTRAPEKKAVPKPPPKSAAEESSAAGESSAADESSETPAGDARPE